jgi:hypothetical protein
MVGAESLYPSMSFVESVLARTREMESLLEQNYGASGKGLHDKASSVEGALDTTRVKRIRYIATIRNKLVHEADYKYDGDEKAFLELCDRLITSLKYPGGMEQGAEIGSVQPTLWTTSQSYPRPSDRYGVQPATKPSSTQPSRRASCLVRLALVIVFCGILFVVWAFVVRRGTNLPIGSIQLPIATTDRTPLPVTVTYPPKATSTKGVVMTATGTSNCPGSPNPSLITNSRAYVNEQMSSTLRVRTKPTTNTDVAGTLQPGEKIQITDGPICADGYWWWKMKSETQPNLLGWVAGGEGTTYWLLPAK